MSTLARLAAIYHLRAKAQLGVLEQARASLREIEQTAAQLGEVGDAARRLAHLSLAESQQQEWLLRESQHELALWNLAALEPLREQRRAEHDQAELDYRNSLREHKQIDSVLARERATALRHAERREQADADDRYLSRARWLARMKERSSGNRSAGSLRACSFRSGDGA